MVGRPEEGYKLKQQRDTDVSRCGGVDLLERIVLQERIDRANAEVNSSKQQDTEQ